MPARGHLAGDPRDDPAYGAIATDAIALEFTRTDTEEPVRVTCHVADVPSDGPATDNLSRLINGTATEAEHEAFAADWYGRVEAILGGERYVTVESR